MLTLDFLIVNTDRHFNNFGVIRNAETLEWIGPAPIFDCGTSMWHDQIVQMIRPGIPPASKPFRKEQSKQIQLVTSFDWLDIAALRGVDEEFAELLKTSVYIDDERRSKLCFALNRRITLLEEAIKH
jgi:hypothetical protein